MDGISTPDTSVASTETVASPATTPASATGSEAVQPGTTNPEPLTQTESNVGETVAGASDELPDDQAFQQLPGEQRASNWSKARARIGELNQRVEQLSQLESFQPVANSIEEMGGWETIEPRLQLANSLFSQVVDPQTGEPAYDDYGYPVYSPAPFVEQIAAESPQMLGDIMWQAFHTPVNGNGDTFGKWLLRSIGLNPGLMDTYKQIQSPDQARQFIVGSGGIDPQILEGVNPEYHDALKSLFSTRPGLRGEWDMISDDAKNELLEERKANLDAQAFIQDRKARDAQDDERRNAYREQQVEQAGAKLVQQVQDQTINANREKLQQTARFFADDGDNQIVHDMIIQKAAERLETDPKLSQDSQRAERLYRLSIQYEAQGDKFRARDTRAQADRLAIKLNKAFGDLVVSETGNWSRRLGGARAAQQQQIQDAKPRIEIGTTGANPTPRESSTAPTPPPGQRFGYSDDMIAQRAQELRNRRTG